MKTKFSVTAMLFFAATFAYADHHKADQMSAEEKAMMETMQRNATPGNHHKRLADSVGAYTAVLHSWSKPGTEPVVAEMKVERKMQLGGRVLEEHWNGKFMDMPFAGISRTGYDNQKNQYWTTWSDNMSTGLYIAYGHWDTENDVLVFEGDATDPMTGKSVATRSVVSYHDDGSEEMAMYQEQDGKEFKAMAFSLSRQ